MTRQQEFINVVRILAPKDQFILEAARHVREEMLPKFPGAAALEFVVAMQRVVSTDLQAGKSEGHRYAPAAPMSMAKPPRRCYLGTLVMENAKKELSLSHALRVKSAEYWLRLGEPVQAMIELQTLSERSRKHPWATKVLVAVTGALREMNEFVTVA